MSTNGDTHLGGADFDNNIVNHLLNRFNDENKGFFSPRKLLSSRVDNSIKEKRAIQKIKRIAEEAKKGLSSRSVMSIDIDSLYDGYDFSEKLSRSQFEKSNSNIF